MKQTAAIDPTNRHTQHTLMKTIQDYSQKPKSHSIDDELIALKQQLVTMKEYCVKEREQNQQLKQQIAKLAHTLQEKERTIEEAAQAAAQSQPLSHDSTHAGTEMAALKKELTDSKQQSKQLERVVRFLRERAEGSHLELVNLKEEFQKTQTLVASTNTELQHTKQQLSQSREDVAKKEKTLHDLQNERDLKFEEKEAVEAALQEARRNFEGILNEVKNKYEAELKEAHSISEAYSQDIIEIQQHFAKKVKEVALLTEQIDEQKNQMQELHQMVIDTQNNAAIVQQNLDLQLQNELKLQENIKTFEGQIRKWEEQYFRTNDKWQEAESRCQELKTIEERHNQVLVILHSLNGLLGLNFYPNDRRELPPSNVPTELQGPKPPPQIRYKQTLFD